MNLRDEQLVVAQVRPTPKETAASWTVLPDRTLDVNWAEILLLAVQHRVEGILEQALDLAGCWDQVSPSVTSTLRQRAEIADSRYVAMQAALAELAERIPDAVSELVFFKGAALVPLYEFPRFRMVGDFDVVVSPDLLPELRKAMRGLGYWEKGGRNGPTFFADAAAAGVGCKYAVFDVHLVMPQKYNRTGVADNDVWLTMTEAHSIGDIACRRLDRHLELLEVLVHMSEHAMSWIHVCLDDDLRLIRCLDVEALCQSAPIDAGVVWEHARRLGLEGEFALGLGLHAAIRGGLPTALAELAPLAAGMSDLLDSLALPDDRLVPWDVDVRERTFLLDRAARALRMMPDETRRRSLWFDWRRGLTSGAEDVADIGRRARSRAATIAVRPR